MIKKIVIGGAAAALLVAGAASANVMTDASNTVLASGFAEVSGATLTDIDMRTFEEGGVGESVAYATLQFDTPNVYVEGSILPVNGKPIVSYFGPDGQPAEVAETYKTDGTGKLTLVFSNKGGFPVPDGADLTSKTVPAADLGGFELNLSNSYTPAS